MKSRVLAPLLEARYHWERGETAQGLQRLNEVLAGGATGTAVYLTETYVEAYSALSFENAVSSILLEEGHLRLPREVAFEQLWRALPAQYLILLLSQWVLNEEPGPHVRELLLEAAAQGVLSERVDDYDVSGRVVVTPEAHPELVAYLGGEPLLARMRQAEEEEAWSRFLGSYPELALELFFYAVFHKERLPLGEMVLIRLERIAECHERFLQASAARLSALLGQGSAHAELVTVGMRLDDVSDPTACLRDFLGAVEGRGFEAFVGRYYP